MSEHYTILFQRTTHGHDTYQKNNKKWLLLVTAIEHMLCYHVNAIALRSVGQRTMQSFAAHEENKIRFHLSFYV